MEITITKAPVKNWLQYRDNLIGLIPNLDNDPILSPHETDYFTDFQNLNDEQGWFHTDYLDGNTPKYYGLVKELVSPIIKDTLKGKGFDIVRMWYSRQNNGDGHPIHHHGNIGYSAVLYVKFNPEVHLPTEYLFPNTKKAKRFPVNEGEFVMFPSRLRHQAPPNQSDEERIIIAMNIAVDN
tara:strand:+ start:947 stop:1489 length:543 start_codon:yes stop_codon:yes gene_type:complete